MLLELRAERDNIDEAILLLERIAARWGERRRRVPALVKQVKRTNRPSRSHNSTGQLPTGRATRFRLEIVHKRGTAEEPKPKVVGTER